MWGFQEFYKVEQFAQMHFDPYFEFYVKNSVDGELKWSHFLIDYMEFNRRKLSSKLYIAFIFLSQFDNRDLVYCNFHQTMIMLEEYY